MSETRPETVPASAAAPPRARLVFVGGAPRSGTTLVQRLLGAHPEIYAGPEFDFVPRLAALRRDMAASVRRGRIAPIVDEAGVDAAVRAFLHAVFDARAAREGASVFAEKTPANIHEFPELVDIFPEARFVFVLRDPRDIAASMKEVGRKHRAAGKAPPAYGRDALSAAEEIARCWARGRAALDAAPDRVLAVHYEDVTADPEGQAQRLCAFLGLAYDPAMVRIEETDASEFASALQTGFYYTPEQVAKGVEAPAPEKFRSILTEAETGVVEGAIPDDPLAARYALRDGAGSLAGSAGAARLRARIERGRRRRAAIRAAGARLRRALGA